MFTPSVNLTAGQKPPQFSTKDVLGQVVDLRKVTDRYVLLVFFRYSSCAWCNLAIHRLTLEYPTLQKHGCEVIAFVQSTQQDILTNIHHRHKIPPPFSIIADKEQKFYKQYGVKTSVSAAARSIKQIPHWLNSVKNHNFKQTKIDGNMFVVPASFLIDNRTKKIAKTSYGTSYYETDAFLDIYQSVFFREL